MWSTRVHRWVFLRGFCQTSFNRNKKKRVSYMHSWFCQHNTHTQSDSRLRKNKQTNDSKIEPQMWTVLFGFKVNFRFFDKNKTLSSDQTLMSIVLSVFVFFSITTHSIFYFFADNSIKYTFVKYVICQKYLEILNFSYTRTETIWQLWIPRPCSRPSWQICWIKLGEYQARSRCLTVYFASSGSQIRQDNPELADCTSCY